MLESAAASGRDEAATDFWPQLLAAANCLAMNSLAECGAHLEKVRARAPEDLAVLSLRAMAETRMGHPGAGRRYLRAVLSRHGQAWLLACKGLVRAEAGEHDGALTDLDAAIVERPEPWFYAMRSRAHERAGDLARAIEDMDLLVSRHPSCGRHYAQRALLRSHRRDYAGALRDWNEAIRLGRPLAEWLRQRAELHLLRGDPDAALLDASEASKLRPLDFLAASRVARFLGYTGRFDEAEAVLRASTANAIDARQAEFERGMFSMRRRRWTEAAHRFAKSASAVDAGSVPRARFYALLARTLGGRGANFPRLRGAHATLTLCGLGLYPPNTMTVEAAHGLTRLDVVFNNVAGPETAELLWALVPRVLPADYDGRRDESPWAACILDELRKGRRVGFATRGHAHVFGGLAAELLERCRAARIPARSYPALSSLDVLAAGSAERLETARGLQAYDASALEQGIRPDARAGLALYFYSGAGPERLRRLAGILADEYPRDHPVFVWGPDYGSPCQYRELRTFLKADTGLDPSVILWLPPRRGPTAA